MLIIQSSLFFFLLIQIKSTTLYYSLFVDDLLLSIEISSIEINSVIYQPAESTMQIVHRGTLEAFEGNRLILHTYNEEGFAGFCTNFTFDNNVYTVNEFHFHFWAIPNGVGLFYLYSMSGFNAAQGDYDFSFRFPFVKYVPFSSNEFIFDVSSFSSLSSFDIIFYNVTNYGKIKLNGADITLKSVKYSSTSTFGYISNNNNKIEIIRFEIYASSSSNVFDGGHIVFVISDKVGKNGFDCKYNMTYSMYNTYCYCKEGYHHIIGNLEECFDENTIPDGYFLNQITLYYEPCYSRCSKCISLGDFSEQKCLRCYPPYYFVEDYLNNCYQYSEVITFPRNDYYLDGDTLRHCSLYWYPPSDNAINVCVDACPDEFPLIVISTRKCVNKCPDGLYKFKNGCYNKCPDGSTNVDYICIETTLMDAPVDSFVHTEQPLDKLLGKIEKNIVEYANNVDGNIKGDGFYIQLYPLGEEKESKEISSIDIGKCESILKEKHHLPLNDKLIILKYDIVSPDTLKNQVEFKVYSSSGVELDLSYCDNVDITINYVLSNTEGLHFEQGVELSKLGVDIYNREDKFYNDKCFPFNSDKGDMILKDRVSDIYVQVDFCDEGCIYEGVDFISNKVKCNCNSQKEKEDYVEKNETESFLMSIYKETNFEILSCSHIMFKKDILKNNYGFYITLTLFILELVLSISYFYQGVTSVLIEIEKASKASAPGKDSVVIFSSTIKISKTTETENSYKKEQEEETTFESGELNVLPYEPALIYDKRNIFIIFYNELICQMDLINIFFFRNPLDLFQICLSSYLFSFCIDITFNSILFSDDVISQKYNNNGKMNQYSSLALSIISSIISSLISQIVNHLISYSLLIEKILKEKNFSCNFWKKMNKYIKAVKLRLFFYCIIQLMLTLFCLLFNSLFCNIYKGSQGNWIMDFILGIGLSLLYTLGISVFVSIIRFTSLKCKCKYLYNVSMYIHKLFN